MLIFSEPVFKTLKLTIKSQIDLIFYADLALDLPKQLQCLVDKKQIYFMKIYLELVVQSSSI